MSTRSRLCRGLTLTITLAMSHQVTADPVEYPATQTVEQRDVFEVAVADPYRWLEEDVRESARVADWVARQNEVTRAYLDGLPGRAQIERRVTELWNYERYSLPVKRGGRYFFLRNDGLQDQAVLYVQDSLEAVPRLLIDPNEWSADGTAALADFEPSPDGAYVAYAVQESGSDWRRLEVLDVASGRTVGEPVRWAKFTLIAWAGDGSGFFYSRFPEPEEGATFQTLNFDQAVYFHRLGSAQAEDRLVYSRPDFPEQGFRVQVTDDGRYLFVTVWKGTDERYEIVVDDLADEAPPRLLIGGFDHEYVLAGNVGTTFYLRTDRDAPRSRIVAVDLDDPAPTRWREIVPEADATLVGASLVGTRLVANYLEHARSAVRLYTLEGRSAGAIALPGLGTASGFAGHPDDPETFFAVDAVSLRRHER